MNSVKPYTSKLNPENAYWMALMSKLVYEKVSYTDFSPNEALILEKLKSEDAKFLSVKGFSKKSSQAALIEHEEFLCMAFRGTDEAIDWLDNIKLFPKEALFGQFHSGFWYALDDIWVRLYGHYLTLREEKKRPLFLTGHSLGGAMATVAAAKFIHEDLPFISVYTFGQPRVMNRETSRIFDMEAKDRFFRFQNNSDIVTRIPARISGYSHVGTPLYISEDRKLYDDPGFWFQFLDSVEGVVESIAGQEPGLIKDHNMDYYLEAVKRWDFQG